MSTFNCKEYQESLLHSKDITDCERVPVPKCAKHQNYIFISYSHKDYKRVYHDLAAMYEAGVRFWYDEELMAGYDWDAEVYKKINDPHCSGVIFYLSESFFTSDS
ncbi:MAG: toll/interleukin-1 receptor domain-containing protein, partial [Clostridia bacterium]|nr:toll/interleukin-1 receptor domain-containing protein [Clostridia bacterium]